MLDLFNIPTPQTANYQEFFGSGGSYVGSGAPRTGMSWMKPRGASMVRIMLIGGGGGGDNGSSTAGGNGGGSGAVTSWIGPAIFIPDELIIFAGAGGTANNDGVATTVAFRLGTFNSNVLSAAAGRGSGGSGAGGTAMSANQFTACGIFTSIAGQAGTAGSSTGAGTNQAASSTTFLSGGAGGAGASGSTGGSVTPNYGYTALSTTAAGGATAAKNGYFITQPILVGTGGAGGSTSTTVGTAGGRGGIGCGGGGGGEDALTGGGQGGGGAVFVWAW
jgi:hypothetical protein